MEVITQPTVTVVGAWQFTGHPEYKVPPDGTNMERGLAFAAKGCYKSFGESGRACKDNQRSIIEHGHGSVAEHATVSFYIEGVTRSLTLEMNRHRHLAISQESTRYVAEEDTSIVLAPHYAWIYENFYIPHYMEDADMKGMDRARAKYMDLYLKSCDQAITDYAVQVQFLMDDNPLNLKGFELRKWARGEARNILPHCIETKVTYTGNLRAWRHFLESRSSRHAEPEIRRLANEVYKKLYDFAPVYFEDYEPAGFPRKNEKPLNYPHYPELMTDYRKI